MHLQHIVTTTSEVENSTKKMDIYLTTENTMQVTRVINSKYHTLTKELDDFLTVIEFQSMIQNLANIDDDLWVQVCALSMD